MSMKHINGSRIVLKLLNSLGHSISYDDAHILDTAIATSVTSDLAEGETYLPTNISPGTFSQVAVDNVDINEETRSGKRTMHVLGIVIYQEQRNTDIAIGFRQEQHKRQVRTMYNTSGINMLDCPNQYKAHTGPCHLLGRVNVNSWFFMQDEKLHEKLTKDKLYVLARLFPAKIYDLDIKALIPKKQSIPSWKGFHAVLQYKFDQQPQKTTIGYNPIIRGIPTRKKTIYTALKLTERQMGAVGGFPSITTLDLQLYIIAQEIRFANWEELGHHIM